MPPSYTIKLLQLLVLAAVALSAPSPQRVVYNVRPVFIHPGTLWCGTGARVSNYSDLGSSFESDRCCRDHDHCQVVIPPLETRYGYTSLFHFTMSLCDCDVKFYFCLQEAHDAESWSVTNWYFEQLRLPCFELVEKPVCLSEGGEHGLLGRFLPARRRCAKNGTQSVAELRRLPFFTDDLERLKKKHMLAGGARQGS